MQPGEFAWHGVRAVDDRRQGLTKKGAQRDAPQPGGCRAEEMAASDAFKVVQEFGRMHIQKTLCCCLPFVNRCIQIHDDLTDRSKRRKMSWIMIGTRLTLADLEVLKRLFIAAGHRENRPLFVV